MRRRILLGAAAAGLSALPRAGRADAWPTRPVRWVVPFPPGGTSDLLARLLAPGLQEAFGQPFVVENRAGAAGTLGSAAVARAPADGHTLLLTSLGPQGLAATMFRSLPYRVVEDFAHIGMIGASVQCLVVNPGFAARDLPGFVAAAREAGRVNAGSSGNGSVAHLTLERFNARAGTAIGHVPYRGSAASLNDVVAGQIPAAFDALGIARPLIEAGRLRLLAVTGARRHQLFPAVPTLAESGWPDLVLASWLGLAAPAGTPAEVVTRLNTALNAQMATPMIRTRLSELTVDAMPLTPGETTAFVAREAETWRPFVIAAGQQDQN